MAFQGLSPERGKTEQLLEIDGAAMVGTKIKAPFGLVPEVYVLPMDNVLATKVGFHSFMAYFTDIFIGYWCRHLCPLRFPGRFCYSQ